MQFLKLRIRNFLSYGNYDTIIDFSKYDKIVRIVGENLDDDKTNSNGSGKSSIIDAVVFALFGKTYRNINIDDIVNKYIGSGCEVEIEFKKNEKIIKIVRYRKHPRYKNNFFVYVDGVQLDHTNQSDLQNKLEKEILEFNFDEFVNICIYNSSLKYFLDFTTSQRYDFLIRYFGFEKINEFELYVKEKHKEINSILTKVISEINIIESNIKKLYNIVKENVSEQIDITNLQKDKESLINERNNYEKAVKFLESEARTIKKIINMLNESLNKDVCEHCLRPLTSESKENINNKLKELTDNYRKTKSDLDRIQNLLNNLEKKIKDIETVISEEEKKRNSLKIVEEIKRNMKESYAQLERLKKEKNDIELQCNAFLLLKDILSKNELQKHLLSVFLEPLENRINYFLSFFFSDLTINIDSDLNLVINRNGKIYTSTGNLSQGERKKFQISFILSLYEMANEIYRNKFPNSIFIDEFDYSLDSQSLSILNSMIREINAKNIFIISHVDDTLENVIHVVKENGFSYIKEE